MGQRKTYKILNFDVTQTIYSLIWIAFVETVHNGTMVPNMFSVHIQRVELVRVHDLY